jgi:hypothetical protein
MATNDDILDAVAANLAQPKRARTDAGEVEQHDLDKQVAAAQFVINGRAAAATSSPFRCLRAAQIESPGASY